ncbi:hypothetical protein NITHO_1110001 [Nitrolancea hollandica Lb]|uniref:Uncharacterized protein n=1 Tax=Nitrolancea hollandica Lb TaxID=1129897 RepID=I4ECK7_9BACT|nr:hypothetical protein NITHO_1110001 [Nitrolancea hollandica Lb]
MAAFGHELLRRPGGGISQNVKGFWEFSLKDIPQCLVRNRSLCTVFGLQTFQFTGRIGPNLHSALAFSEGSDFNLHPRDWLSRTLASFSNPWRFRFTA